MNGKKSVPLYALRADYRAQWAVWQRKKQEASPT